MNLTLSRNVWRWYFNSFAHLLIPTFPSDMLYLTGLGPWLICDALRLTSISECGSRQLCVLTDQLSANMFVEDGLSLAMLPRYVEKRDVKTRHHQRKLLHSTPCRQRTRHRSIAPDDRPRSSKGCRVTRTGVEAHFLEQFGRNRGASRPPRLCGRRARADICQDKRCRWTDPAANESARWRDGARWRQRHSSPSITFEKSIDGGHTAMLSRRLELTPGAVAWDLPSVASNGTLAFDSCNISGVKRYRTWCLPTWFKDCFGSNLKPLTTRTSTTGDL